MILPTRMILQFEHVAGFRIRDKVWQHLARSGQLARYLSGTASMAELIAEIRSLQQFLGPPVPVEGDAPSMLTGDWAGPKTVDTRDEAVSRLIAHIAAERADVVQFRADPANQIPPDLLAWRDVHQWIWVRAREDGDRLPRLWTLTEATIPQVFSGAIAAALIPGAALPDEPRTIELQVPLQNAVHHVYQPYLVYAKEGDDRDTGVLINAGGVLDRLRVLSERLASAYLWKPAQATIFILAGLSPLVASFTADPITREDLPVLSRVNLSIDPAMSPTEVAERYSALRQWLLNESKERQRDLSEKHAQLALFAARQPKQTTWARRMAQWNTVHPEWTYTEVSNFSRDCLQAQRRLLGTTISQREKGEADDGQKALER
jgi:hypothetical protein